MKLKFDYILFLLIFLLTFTLRFFMLGSVPDGLYQDETAIGYNAYSVLTTGKDEYGKSFPLYFKSFGDQKLPVYIYSTVISEAIFGVNAFAVRFPSAFFGTLTVVFLFLFVTSLTKNKRLALTSSFLYAINPWALHYNRATFEVNICLFLFLAGSYLLLKSFENKKKGFFFLGTVLFIICLYSYNLTRLLAPALYLVILFTHRKNIKNISKTEKIVSLIVGAVMLLPFAVSFFDNGGASSARGTFLFSSNAVKAPLLEFKSYFIYSPLFSKIFLNMPSLMLWQYMNNIVTYFSTPFLFIAGTTHGNHGIGNFGQFFPFEFPLIIIGATLFIRNKIGGKKTLFSWGILTILVASLTRDVPQATRSFFLIVPLIVFSGAGLLFVIDRLINIKGNATKAVFSLLAFLIVVYSLVFYFASYYVRFPILYAKNWNQQDKSVVDFINQNKSNYENVIFDKKAGFVYSSYLFYSKYDPQKFYSTVKRLPDDNEGFSIVEKFGNIEFKDVDWNTDPRRKGVLIVTNANNKPKEIESIATFDYPLRPVVVSLQEKLFEFPVTDNAYTLVEGKE